jgi:Family of unknown function (DUF6328)
MPNASPERYTRDETDAQRLDRNYNEQLQELRVAQAGVQILFAFLLTIAFQQRFSSINEFLKVVYVITLVCASLSAALFIAPVAVHRVMFRRHLKDELVEFTDRLSIAGLVFLALTVLGALLLIVDFVVGPITAGIIAGLMALIFGYLWYVLPVMWRARTEKK